MIKGSVAEHSFTPGIDHHKEATMRRQSDKGLKGRTDRRFVSAARFGAISVCLLCVPGAGGCAATLPGNEGPGMAAPSARVLALDCVKAGIQYPHNPAVRVAAIEAMETADPQLTLPWIRTALLDDHPAVRFAGCLAVGNSRDALAAAAVEKCVYDPSDSVKVAALFARHRLGRTDQTGRIPTYLLHDQDPMVRRNAAMVLGLLGEPAAIPVLARAVKDDPEPGVRHHALEAMARLGNAEACAELTFSTNSGVGSEEVMALQALSASRDPKFADTYRYKLNTATHLETRLAAARGLGLLGFDDGRELALQTLTAPKATVNDANDSPAGQRLRLELLAAAALGAIGEDETLNALARVIQKHPDPRVQLAAAKAVLEILSRQTQLHAERSILGVEGQMGRP